MTELTRKDRKAAVERLDAMAAEISEMARWLDQYGDDADKAAVLLECGARDLAAACWVIRPADHTMPDGWLDGSRAMRG